MSNTVFLSTVTKITAHDLGLVSLIETAAELVGAGHPDQAVQVYKIWLRFNPKDPLAHAAHFNAAALLSQMGDLTGARKALEDALAANPDFLPAYINLGVVLERLGLPHDAVTQWTSLASRLAPVTGNAISYKATALKQISRVLEAHQQFAEAEATLRQSLEIDKNQREILEHFTALRLLQCQWPVMVPPEGVERRMLMMDISPLSMAAYTDDPLLQLATAAYHNKSAVGIPPVNLQAAPRPASPSSTSPAPTGTPAGSRRLRIGYLSSDLRDHAIGYLMAEIFGLHDRQSFEIFAYYCGAPGQDRLTTRIRAAVEHWVDINGLDDDAAARRMAEDGIDILVDVNGYTRDARTAVVARRPAPVIVNWLGYPGTMGSPYHHYIVADPWIIPPGHEPYFSEKVVRLPCYQPSDRKRVIAPNRPSRRDVGLPEDAFVYGCFNGTQKISRFTFERWMAILKRVPNGVLWLLTGTEATNARLKERAEQHGVAASRVIFAGKMANSDHLARYPLIDLVLDTAPYGAHTTANDALWLGVPILTLSGRSFASRVCGSLVRAAGLPECVCDTPEAYVERAVALEKDRATLRSYKDRLAAGRDSCVLFDMERLVGSLQSLYRTMVEDYRQGRLPRPDLANLDVYQEVGIAVDHEAVEVLAMPDPDYERWFRTLLADRHRVWPIRPDRRLWQDADLARAEGAEQGTEQGAGNFAETDTVF